MDERKNSLSTSKVCRFCLSHDEDFLESLYDRSNKPIKNVVTLPLKILSCLSVEVFPSDKMPNFICKKCKYFMDLFYGFKDICRRSDETILNFIQNETALAPTVWPALYDKVFKNVTKQTPDINTGIVKTVVKSGATVQVMTQDSESEGEESSYDVKIEDDDESTECINVIASKNVSDNKSKPMKVVTDKQDSDIENMVADGRWPCDECDSTYPLQQLLDLHKMKKHRKRVASCDQCDVKCFSKYDLEVHKLCHTDDTPHQCVACGKKFKRMSLLKRHEKTIHSDLLQQKCETCSATFISKEELDVHKKRHTDSDNRYYACASCDKRFTRRNSLHRHMITVHTSRAELSCEYCPERFSTVPKLTKHVRTHAGARSYPCKYCDKSFVKSHHYTRHIRLRHREASIPDLIEQYRCEQCDDTFTTQDDLIYHSAIHATQNLTCPLCQEKFEDVDAVTAHIKSHVSGVEFQCEFCELVFTSKEKLKCHMIVEHEDEYQNMQDEDSSMDMDDFEEEDTINLKEEDDHMVVEINKADSFMLPISTEIKEEDKISPSEGSEPEGMDTEFTVRKIVTPIVTHKNDVPMIELNPLITKADAVNITPLKQTAPPQEAAAIDNIQTPSIVKKAEEVKRKLQSSDAIPEKKTKHTPNSSISDSTSATVTTSCGTNGPTGASIVTNTSSGGTTDKSLRLLEKELQELKRTNVRKAAEAPKRRPPPHTSTPKLRSTDEKKGPVGLRSSTGNAEKKALERRAIKENKEPKEVKETKTVTVTKDDKEKAKEDKEKTNNAKEEKDTKENDTSKNSIKNGTSDKTATPDEGGVRRSTRPSKIKDYAKMIRERTQGGSGDDDDSDDDDEEYVEPEKSTEARSSRGRRSAVKLAATKTAAKSSPVPKATSVNPRKRGRPRKDQPPDTSAKVMKENSEEGEETKATTATDTSTAEEEDISKSAVEDQDLTEKSLKTVVKDKEPPENNKAQNTTISEKNDSHNATDNHSKEENVVSDGNKTPSEEQKTATNLLVSPIGQTLKKVPIRALPPGVKPLPLPTTARAMGPRETCEMQIGKKLVKVQKIVMTKAEVEAMAKKGLLEMKDGTMVLKQGIKLHPTESSAVKPAPTEGTASKESPIISKDKPMRCDFEESSTPV